METYQAVDNRPIFYRFL